MPNFPRERETAKVRFCATTEKELQRLLASYLLTGIHPAKPLVPKAH